MVKVKQNIVQYPAKHMTYAPAKFEVATSNNLGEDGLTRKYIIWPWPWGQGHTKCYPVASTSYDLCTCEHWSCYVQWFRRRCIYKKMHYLTLTLRSRSHEVVPSTLYIMWPMHRKKFEVATSKSYEEMHLHENTLFDLWPWHWGQGHMKCCLLPSTSCDLCTGKIWSCYF